MDQYNYDSITSSLRSGIGTVIFTKVDGSERTMECTLMDSYLPESHSTNQSSSPQGVQTTISVWDVNKNNWRSFRIDNIKSFSVRSA